MYKSYSTVWFKKFVHVPVVSKIAKPKAQSEDRELSSKTPDNGSVRLQQIGIEPSPVSGIFRSLIIFVMLTKFNT